MPFDLQLDAIWDTITICVEQAKSGIFLVNIPVEVSYPVEDRLHGY